MADFKKKVQKKAAENPALQFFSQAEEKPQEERPRKAETRPLYTRPKQQEYKTRRLQLLLRPSLYEEIKEAADREGASVNDLIHCILENAIEGSERE